MYASLAKVSSVRLLASTGGPVAVPKVQKLLEAVFWLSKVAFTQSADRALVSARISSKEALTAEVREKGDSPTAVAGELAKKVPVLSSTPFT